MFCIPLWNTSGIHNFMDSIYIGLNGIHLDLEFFVLSIRNTFGLRKFQRQHVHTFEWNTSWLRIFSSCTYGIHLDLEFFQAVHMEYIILNLENFKNFSNFHTFEWSISEHNILHNTDLPTHIYLIIYSELLSILKI